MAARGWSPRSRSPLAWPRLGLSACSAGQITQTSTQVAAVPGANANAGPGGSIALRNALIPYNGLQGYPQGGNAPLVVRIFNDGLTAITLVKVTADGTAANVAPVAGGEGHQPAAGADHRASDHRGTEAVRVGQPRCLRLGPRVGRADVGRPDHAAPSPAAGRHRHLDRRSRRPGYALLVPGRATYLQLTGLTQALTPGMTVPVTFTFDDGSSGHPEPPGRTGHRGRAARHVRGSAGRRVAPPGAGPAIRQEHVRPGG